MCRQHPKYSFADNVEDLATIGGPVAPKVSGYSTQHEFNCRWESNGQAGNFRVVFLVGKSYGEVIKVTEFRWP